MASLNKVFLIGNLTRPPELRYTPSGTAVADVRLAVNRNYTTQGGETREWEGKDGQKRTVIEVVAERVQFLGRGKTAAAPATVPAAEPAFSEESKPGGDDDVPF